MSAPLRKRSLYVWQQHWFGFARPTLFPRRPRRFACAIAQTVERRLVGRVGLEQIEDHIGKLPGRGKQQTVVAVPDALGQTRAVVQRAYRHAGPEQIRHLHRDVQTRGGSMQAQPEVRATDDARIVLGLEPARAQLDAACWQASKTALELGAARTVAGDEDDQIRKTPRRRCSFPAANAVLETWHGVDNQVEVIVLRPT